MTSPRLAPRALRATPALLLALMLIPFPAAALLTETVALPVLEADAPCVAGSPEAAAAALVHPEAVIESTEEIAGFTSALAIAPFIHPGTRFRLMEAEGVWCRADTGFNTAWRLSGKPADGAEMARAFATLAPAPHFDGVTVTSLTETAPGAYLLETHARTNGILATWTLTTDATGILEASWTSHGLGVAPFEGEIEGVTALPGASVGYLRDGDGSALGYRDLPTWDAIAQATATPSPRILMSAVANDGFEIRIAPFGAIVYPHLGPDNADPVTAMHENILAHALSNYNEILTWGLKKGWTSNIGNIYVDSPASTAPIGPYGGLTCTACVYIGRAFNVHITSQAARAVEILAGVSYPDDDASFGNILGHELFHNFQNAASGGLVTITAISEGTARFAETLHTYRAISHQGRSLVYSNSDNGCNGYNAYALNLGPATASHSYDTCLFWLSWYGHHGMPALVNMLKALKTMGSRTTWDQMRYAVTTATGTPIEDDLARFAAAFISGEGYRLRQGDGNGSEVDWAIYLDKWVPSSVNANVVLTATVADGGMAGWRLLQGGTFDITSGPALPTYVIRNPSNGAPTVTRITEGTLVAAPVTGEPAYLVVVQPGVGSATMKFKLAP